MYSPGFFTSCSIYAHILNYDTFMTSKHTQYLSMVMGQWMVMLVSQLHVPIMYRNPSPLSKISTIFMHFDTSDNSPDCESLLESPASVWNTLRTKKGIYLQLLRCKPNREVLLDRIPNWVLKTCAQKLSLILPFVFSPVESEINTV